MSDRQVRTVLHLVCRQQAAQRHRSNSTLIVCRGSTLEHAHWLINLAQLYFSQACRLCTAMPQQLMNLAAACLQAVSVAPAVNNPAWLHQIAALERQARPWLPIPDRSSCVGLRADCHMQPLPRIFQLSLHQILITGPTQQ